MSSAIAMAEPACPMPPPYDGITLADNGHYRPQDLCHIDLLDPLDRRCHVLRSCQCCPWLQFPRSVSHGALSVSLASGPLLAMPDCRLQQHFKVVVEQDKHGFGPPAIPRAIEVLDREHQRIDRLAAKLSNFLPHSTPYRSSVQPKATERSRRVPVAADRWTTRPFRPRSGKTACHRKPECAARFPGDPRSRAAPAACRCDSGVGT